MANMELSSSRGLQYFSTVELPPFVRPNVDFDYLKATRRRLGIGRLNIQIRHLPEVSAPYHHRWDDSAQMGLPDIFTYYDGKLVINTANRIQSGINVGDRAEWIRYLNEGAGQLISDALMRRITCVGQTMQDFTGFVAAGLGSFAADYLYPNSTIADNLVLYGALSTWIWWSFLDRAKMFESDDVNKRFSPLLPMGPRVLDLCGQVMDRRKVFV